MRYTRDQLLAVTQNHTEVKPFIQNGRDPRSSINSLMSDLVAKGLSYREDKLSFHSRGRAEHTYDAQELMGYFGGYLAATEGHKLCLKRAQVLAIVSHFKELGYDSNVSPKKKSKTRALREFIFGKKNSDSYYT
jgi:hypothetical protein